MTDNTPMVPTEDELMDLGHECELDAIEFGRAVLTRWGQPAHSGEPVAWLDPWTGTKVTTDYDAYGKHGIPLVHQQPQPVAREPLTPEQIAEMMRDTWGCASIAPRHALAFARAVERAHGIKGGQHGTE